MTALVKHLNLVLKTKNMESNGSHQIRTKKIGTLLIQRQFLLRLPAPWGRLRRCQKSAGNILVYGPRLLVLWSVLLLTLQLKSSSKLECIENGTRRSVEFSITQSKLQLQNSSIPRPSTMDRSKVTTMFCTATNAIVEEKNFWTYNHERITSPPHIGHIIALRFNKRAKQGNCAAVYFKPL